MPSVQDYINQGAEAYRNSNPDDPNAIPIGIDLNSDNVEEQTRNYLKSIYRGTENQDQLFKMIDDLDFTNTPIVDTTPAISDPIISDTQTTTPTVQSTQAPIIDPEIEKQERITRLETIVNKDRTFSSMRDLRANSEDEKEAAENLVRLVVRKVGTDEKVRFKLALSELKKEMGAFADGKLINAYIDEFTGGTRNLDKFSITDIDAQRRAELDLLKNLQQRESEPTRVDRAFASKDVLDVQDRITDLQSATTELDSFRKDKRVSVTNEVFEKSDFIIESLKDGTPLPDDLVSRIETTLPIIGGTISRIQSGNPDFISTLQEQIKGSKSYIDLREGDREEKEIELIKSTEDAANAFAEEYAQSIDSAVEPSKAQERFAEQLSDVGDIFTGDLYKDASNLLDVAKITFNNGGGFLDTLADSAYSLGRSLGYTIAGATAGGVVGGLAGGAAGGAAGAGAAAYKEAYGQFVLDSIKSNIEKKGIEITKDNAREQVSLVVNDDDFMGDVIVNANRYALGQSAVATATGAFAPYARTLQQVTTLGGASVVGDLIALNTAEQTLTGETPEQRSEQARAGGIQSDAATNITTAVLGTAFSGVEIGASAGGARLGSFRRNRISEDDTAENVSPVTVEPPLSETNQKIRTNTTAQNAAKRKVAYTADELQELRSLKSEFRSINTGGEAKFAQFSDDLIGDVFVKDKEKRINDAYEFIRQGDYDGAARILNPSSKAAKTALAPLRNAVLALGDVDNSSRNSFGVKYDPERDSGSLGVTDGQLLNSLQDPNSRFAKEIQQGNTNSSQYKRFVELFEKGDIAAVAKRIESLGIKGAVSKQLRAISQQLNNIVKQSDRPDVLTPVVGADGRVIVNATPDNLREVINDVNDRTTYDFKNNTDIEADFISNLEPDANVLADTPTERSRLEAAKVEDHLNQLNSETKIIAYIKELALVKNLRDRFSNKEGATQFLKDYGIEPDQRVIDLIVNSFNLADEGQVTDGGLVNRLNAVVDSFESNTDLANTTLKNNAITSLFKEITRINNIYKEKDTRVVLADGFGTNDLIFRRLREWINDNPNVDVESLRSDFDEVARQNRAAPDTDIGITPENDLFGDYRDKDSAPISDEAIQEDTATVDDIESGVAQTEEAQSFKNEQRKTTESAARKKARESISLTLKRNAPTISKAYRREKLDTALIDVISYYESSRGAVAEISSNAFEYALHSLRKATGVDYWSLSKADRENMWLYLKGKDVRLRPKVATVLDAMNDDITDKSARLERVLDSLGELAATTGNQDVLDQYTRMRDTIDANKGRYLNRSFIAFLRDPKLYDDYLNSNYQNTNKTAKATAIEALMQSENISISQANEKVDLLINGAKNGSHIGLLLESSSPFTGILKEKKKIPPWALIALGEDRDAFRAYARTISSQDNLESYLTFQFGMSKQLIDMGYASAEYPAGSDFSRLSDTSRVNKYSPLNDMFVDPIVADIIKRHVNQSTSDTLIYVNRLNFVFKASNTVLNPATHALQYAGFLYFLAQNGLSNPKAVINAAKLMRQFRLERKKGANNRYSDLHKALLKYGVVNSSFGVKDLDAIVDSGLNFDTDEFTALMLAQTNGTKVNTLGTAIQASKGSAKRGFARTGNIYGKPDEFLKVINYVSNYEIHKQRGLSDAEALDLAAKEATDTLPTSTKLVSLLKEARAPTAAGGLIALTLFNPFIGFTALSSYVLIKAIARTASDIKLYNQDKIKNLPLKRRAISTGLGIAALTGYSLREEFFNFNDDESDGINTIQHSYLYRPYMRGVSSHHQGYDSDGSLLTSVDHFTNPFSPIFNIARIGITYLKGDINISEMNEFMAASIAKDLFGGSFGLQALNLVASITNFESDNAAVNRNFEEILKAGRTGAVRLATDIIDQNAQTDSAEGRRELTNTIKKLFRREYMIDTPSDVGGNVGSNMKNDLNTLFSKGAPSAVFKDKLLSPEDKIDSDANLKAWKELSEETLAIAKKGATETVFYFNKLRDQGLYTDQIRDNVIEAIGSRAGSIKLTKKVMTGLIQLADSGRLDAVNIYTKFDGKRLLEPSSYRETDAYEKPRTTGGDVMSGKSGIIRRQALYDERIRDLEARILTGL